MKIEAFTMVMKLRSYGVLIKTVSVEISQIYGQYPGIIKTVDQFAFDIRRNFFKPFFRKFFKDCVVQIIAYYLAV